MRTLRFEPKEDITAWELAQIFKLDTMMGKTSKTFLGLPGEELKDPVVEYLDSLPKNVKRHLVIRDE